MALHESAEMYLETIYVLSTQKSTVRSVDVAEALNYSKPSVSRAVGLLKHGGYLTADEDGFLILTPSGMEIGKKIYERHTLLENFLTALGVDPKIAEVDACKMEHAISDESFIAIQAFMDNWKK